MISTLALSALLAPLALAVPCVQFDTNWDLYAFGGSQDVKLGANSSWASPQATPLTTDGRPPWTGNNTQCLLSQYNNAMYVLGGDSSDLSKIYIYDFAGGSWSTQDTSSLPSNLGDSRSASVLDHDTNVIFTLSSGSGATMYQLDLSSVKATAGPSAAWSSVENPSFSVSGYNGVAAQASNHINFFGVPNTAAGSANIFVVHYSYFQPEAQTYPTQGGGSAFPDSAGQAFSIPDSQNNAPNQMVFVPNDFSNSYVVTHWTNPGSYNSTDGVPFATDLINSTQLLPAPSSKDNMASYAASPNDLVQIDGAGNIYYMTSAINGDYTVNSGAQWTKMNYALAGTGGSNSSSSSGSGSSASASGSASATGSMSGSSGRKTSGTSASGSSKSSGGSSTSGAAGVAASIGRLDQIGLAAGLAVLGAALVL